MSERQGKYEVAVRDEVLVPSWQLMREQAKVLHDSGFFPKVIKGPSQALAIMLAGRELGIGPMESLRSVYVVDGQTTISSGLMAAMIWGAGHAYNIDESTDTACQITFTRNNGQTYTHRYTIEDAKRAQLLSKRNWQQYAKAMLFNRCISAGGRAFMPDVTRRMYTPEEMGAPVTVSESGDIVIDVKAREITEPEPVTNGRPNLGPRPWKPEELRAALTYNVGQKKLTGDPTQAQIGLLANKLEEVLGADQDSQVNRYTLTEWLAGERSLRKVGIAWVDTLLDWLLDAKDTTGDYPFKAHAVAEANEALRQAMLDQGQMTLTKAQFRAADEKHRDGLGFNGSQKGPNDA